MNFKELKRFIGFRVRHYSPFNFKRTNKTVIVSFESNLGKAGLADRLRHCLSVYLFCKKRGLNFKISHLEPFKLDSILKPNKYDWSLGDSNVSVSMLFTRTIILFSKYKSNVCSEDEEAISQEKYLNNVIKNRNLEYHVYGNVHLYKSEWAQAWDELFVPSEELLSRLREQNLPEIYEGVTLRFQQLLGDFKEDGYNILSEEEQYELIQKCIDRIILLKDKGYFKCHNILVTSDSLRFLNEVRKLPFVYTISGERAHPAYSKDRSEHVFLNSFVDLLALRNAQRVTLLQTGQLYKSGFPEFAASIGNRCFLVDKF